MSKLEDYDFTSQLALNVFALKDMHHIRFVQARLGARLLDVCNVLFL